MVAETGGKPVAGLTSLTTLPGSGDGNRRGKRMDLISEVKKITGKEIDTEFLDFFDKVMDLVSSRISAEKADDPDLYERAVERLRNAEGSKKYEVYLKLWPRVKVALGNLKGE